MPKTRSMSSSVVMSTSQNAMSSLMHLPASAWRPQLDAIVEIDAGAARRRPGRPRALRVVTSAALALRAGRDAGDVEPFRAGEDLGPGHHARLDAGDGGALAVVEHAAGARRGAELEEVDADAIVVRPDDMLGARRRLRAHGWR